MKRYLRKMKNEKGAVTILVAVTVLTFVMVLLGAYLTVTALKQSQLKSDIRIQEVYGRDVNRVDEVYEELIQKNNPTIENLRTSGTAVGSKTEAIDSNGNIIVIPAGFKVASDSGANVTEGIVI